ncbi:type II toxin-antitoxin system VapC family toxin [Streptomyces sp. XD-27]|uniref:type II toxin-antitoxin system VapC family toxin n=1 Tax=Streptomyces sp. XD-27 TaxID=3062779 RepID=UPI0026F42679|nr:PIN domain-containing protein [Streptomyces sp. XD-27]WKX70732.1 PIN domain-containing protein [Streptomyces sp. XD-27]
MRSLLLDTGVLYAIADDGDDDHRRCWDFVAAWRGRLLVPAPVVAETAWLIERRLGPEHEGIFVDLIAGGQLGAVDLEVQDYVRIAELIRKYADFPLGTVDASVVAVAERLRLTEIATIDHRHFSAVQPNHVGSFTLLP